MEPLLDAMITLVVLAMIIERALAIVFDMEKLQTVVSKFDLKPIVAIIVSLLVCYAMGFNLPKVLANSCEQCQKTAFDAGIPYGLGILLTGFVVAGGSAGAVKLFQDVLGFRRATRDAAKELAAAETEAAKAEADARIAKAAADKELADQQKVAASVTAPGGIAGVQSTAFVERELRDAYFKALGQIGVG